MDVAIVSKNASQVAWLATIVRGRGHRITAEAASAQLLIADSLEVCSATRAQLAGERLVILVTLSDAVPTEIERAFASGADDFLPLPLTANQVFGRLLVAERMVNERMASLGALPADVAHEINNPLSYTLTNLNYVSELLGALAAKLDNASEGSQLEAFAVREPVREMIAALNEAIDGGGRVRDLVRQLGDVSRTRALPEKSTEEQIAERAPLHVPTLPSAGHEQDAAQTARRGRLLFIDDEPGLARSLERFLSRSHEITFMTSAREALTQLLAGAAFDVIFCDMVMPEMGGMELFTALSDAKNPFAEKLVFMTGGAFTPSARSFLERVSNERLYKPIDIEELQRVVAAHLNAP